MMFSSSYLSVFMVNKMILRNINQGRKHELTNDMMKRSERVNCEVQQRLDDFLRAK